MLFFLFGYRTIDRNINVKKAYFLIIALWLTSSGIFAQDDMLGQEFIKPLKYPKFSLSGDYNLLRRFHGFADPALRANLKNAFGATLSFETGLYKYFNAGALFSAFIPAEFLKSEPVHIRFALFAKPYYPITNNFAVFGRITGGISTAMGMMMGYIGETHSSDLNQALRKVYQGQQYSLMAPGIVGSATIGLEYFPFSRFGLAFETGIRVETFFVLKGNALIEHFTEKNQSGVGPRSFNYMVYEIPLALTLHFIL